MADRKITDLTEISALSADDVIHIIDFNPSARNTKITMANFLSFIPSNTTFGSSSTPCDVTIYGSNMNANQTFTSANDTHTFNCNTQFTSFVSIGDATTFNSLVFNHWGYYNITGEVNAAAANVIVGTTGVGNGKKLELYGDTGHIKTDGDQAVEISGQLNVIANSVIVGNNTVGQDLKAWGEDGIATDWVWWKKATSTLEVANPTQIVANSSGALYVDGASQLGCEATGSDLKVIGSGGYNIYFDSAANKWTQNVANTEWAGDFHFGNGGLGNQYDMTLYGAGGNTFWDGSATQMTINGGLNANGITEVGQSGAGFNVTINGSNGARGLYWNSATDVMTANVAGTDGFIVHGSLVTGQDTVEANVTFHSSSTNENLFFNGTDRELSYTSTSTEGATFTSNVHLGAADSTSDGLHMYGPGLMRVQTTPVGIGDSNINFAYATGGNTLEDTVVMQNASAPPSITQVQAVPNHTQAYLYGKVDSGSCSVWAMDSNGVEVRQASHEDGEWVHYERVPQADGKVLNRKINMLKLARALEQVTGESLVTEWTE